MRPEPEGSGGPRRGAPGNQAVDCRVVEAEHPEIREFMAREWPAADRRLFGAGVDWTSRPVVVEARAGRELAGVALGETVAGMARLHDLLVAEPGAARCFLRCPATDRHRRFYERLGFVQVARLPRYYHDHDFIEYLREPLVQKDSGAR
jgi:hypothetical protein